MKEYIIPVRLLLLLSLAVSVTSIQAVTRTWNGGTGNWNAGNNWTPLGIPAATDAVVINSGTVNLQNANGSCLSIALASGAALNIASTRILTVGLGSSTIGGSVSNSGTIAFNGPVALNSGATVTTNAGGTITINGNLASSGTLANGGTLTVASGGSLSNNSGGSLINNGTLTNNGALANYATLLNVSGTININSAGVINNYQFFHNQSGGTITGSGYFRLRSGGQFLDQGTYSFSGVEQAYRLFTANVFHYYSPPVTMPGSFSSNSAALDLSGTDRFYFWDENYHPASDPDSLPGVWVDIRSGTNSGGTAAWTNSGFVAGEGYAANYSTEKTVVFTGGDFYKSQVNYTMTTTVPTGSGIPWNYQAGWNLAGNPFPCALNANTAANATNNFLTTNASVLEDGYEAVYIWDPVTSSYRALSNAGGVGGTIGTEITTAAYIAPWQGFFVRANNVTGNYSLSLPPSIRTLNVNGSFVKSTGDVARVALSLEGPQSDIGSILVVFGDGMTDGLDPSYDVGILKGNPNLALYSRVEGSDIEFEHQALPLELDNRHVGVSLDAGLSGTYSFRPVTVENMADSIRIRLEDLEDGSSVDIMSEGYTFTLEEPGTIEGRFRLYFYNTALGTKDPEALPELSTTAAGGRLLVRSLDPKVKISHVTLVNTLGQVLAERSFENQEEVQVEIPARGQLVVARVTTTSGTVIKKIFSR